MVVGAVANRTELAVVGAGPGGYVAALRAADAGLDVTLIHRDQLGGTCLNVGCIPSKTLIEIANRRHGALHAADIGLDATVDVRMDAVSEHLTTVSGRLRAGVRTLLQEAGVTVIRGDASFARYDRLSIAHGETVSHLEFDNVILATGSRPIELPGFPFEGRTLSSTGALAIDSLPRTACVVGGGYIGVELGTAWAKLGVEVTLVEAAPSILPAVPAQLRQPVEKRLAELGVTVKVNARADRPMAVGLVLDDGQAIEADLVVVAVGRRPNSDQASIDTLGLRLARSGHIRVDDHMRAGSGVYAIGDLVAGPALAHKATAEAEIAVAALRSEPVATAPVIPEVIFSDPEIMMAGVSIDEALTGDYAVSRFPHGALARAHSIGQAAGSTYLVTDTAATVVGLHAVGPHVSELAGQATIAIEMAATREDLASIVQVHPTMAESVAEAAWLAAGLPLHVRR